MENPHKHENHMCLCFRNTLHYVDKMSQQRWQYPKSLSLWEHFESSNTKQLITHMFFFLYFANIKKHVCLWWVNLGLEDMQSVHYKNHYVNGMSS